MAESDNESFILIDVNEQNGKKTVNQQVMFENAQLTQSILQANDNNNIAGSVHSIDQWSEVSAPSIKSINSVPTRQVVTESTLGFSVFSGTFLSGPAPMMPGMTTYDTAGSDKGYYMINKNGATPSQEHDGPILSDSTQENDLNDDNDNDDGNDNNNDNNNNLATIGGQEVHSIGSVGTRVPFSWAEITKIQPQFHNDAVQKPKVFESTPKIQTRYRLKEKKKDNDDKCQVVESNTNKINYNDHNNESMPAIPESDPYATKSDLGRRVRRSGKRGSRLKYPNGRRGTRKNWRKKNQNK